LELTPEVIKKLRHDLDHTQAEMAAKLGVTVQAYQNWEAGKTIPQAANRRKLRKLLEEVYGEKVG